MGKNQIYPYAVARIRMLENSLLTEKQYLQMVDAKDAESAIKVLNEVGYTANGDQTTVRNYETALSARLSKAYEDVSELVSGENFMDVFLFKNDYHNLKVLMKSEISGIDGNRYLVEGGTVDKEVLKNAFQTKNLDTLPANMSDAVNRAYEAYGKAQSGQMIDVVLDKAAFKDMNQTAEKSGNEFVKKYMEHLCDVTNLKGFLRIRNMKKSFETLAEVFIDGGSLGLETYKKAFSDENPSAGFKSTHYSGLCQHMTEGFTAFEKECDNYLMAFVKEAKYRSLTLEPMVAFIYAKETEVKTVRIILNSKINNIETEVTKERLRDAYV